MAVREKLIENIKNELNLSIQKAIENGELSFDKSNCPEIIIEVPREKEHGDFSSPIAMHLPRLAHKAPKEIADIIVNNFDKSNSYIEEIKIEGPGFINFTLSPTWLGPVLDEILQEKENYGRNNNGENKKVNIEYISANPTGPMHIGNARGGAIGDVLANIFEFSGFNTTKEFYVNDAGNQIEKFGQSLNLRLQELIGEEVDFPEDLYQGKDIIERAKEFLDSLSSEELKNYLNLDEENRINQITEFALNKNLEQMKSDLEQYGINYDVWFSEKSLHDSNQVKDALNLLINSGKTYEKEEAIWFKSTDYGLEKDDVLVRSNGIPTYYLADIAYHINKFNKRQFDYGINVWGADHYGHIKRLKSALEAVGIKDKLEILTMQLVRLKKNEELVRVSKRKGNTISLNDLINQIGKDAARFFFNLRSPDSQFELDLELALKESSDNPVFYVQYAHARISSILRKIINDYNEKLVNPNLLQSEEELALLEILSKFPEEINISRENLDPSRLTRYSIDLASAFHSFYNACRVNVEDEALKSTRIALIQATKQVLQNCSKLLGIETPEKM